MNKSAFFWLISVSALAMSACTQEAAPVLYKGDEFFGREHEGVVNAPDNNETFDVDSPRYKRGYARPVEDAAVTSVGVNDLPPPTVARNASVESHDLGAPEKPTATTGNNGQTHYLNKEPYHSNATVEVQDQSATDDKPVTEEKGAHKAASKGNSKFIWPVDGGKVISRFGSNPTSDNEKGNDGINIAMSEGEPIFAVADGVVVYAGNELAGYGNMVILRHENGFMTAYAHARSLAVKKGTKVKQSDLIAYVGSTGGVKTPQVHFVLRKGKTPVNPEEYLPHN